MDNFLQNDSDFQVDFKVKLSRHTIIYTVLVQSYIYPNSIIVFSLIVTEIVEFVQMRHFINFQTVCLLRKFCCKKYYDGSYFMAEADRSPSIITWGCFEKDYKRPTTLDHKSNMIHLHASRDENKNAFFPSLFFSLLQHFLF